MTVRELITKYGFDVDDKPLDEMDKKLISIKGTILAVGTLAAASAGALFGMAKKVAALGDDAAKTAKSVGLTAESLQELQFAAGIGGVEAGNLNTSLQRFSRIVLDARRGNETYLRSFKDLGVSQDLLNDKNATTKDFLLEISDRISKMPDGFKKSGLAIELFGRTGAKLIPLLNEGRAGINKLTQEAQDLGFVIGEQTTKDSEEFNDAIFRLKAVTRGFMVLITKDLLPVFTELIDNFRNFIRENKEMLKLKAAEFIKNLMFFIKGFVSIMGAAWKILNNIVQLFGGWNNVIQAVQVALLGLLGAQMLLGLASFAGGVIKIIQLMRTLRLSTLLANAAALAIPILIGAAIAVLGLAIEDIITYFQGGDSVTGVIIREFQAMFKKVEGFFDTFGTKVKVAMAVILTPIRAVISALRTISNVSFALSSGQGVKGALSALKKGVLNFVNPLAQSAAGNGEDLSLRSVLGVEQQLGATPGVSSVQNSSAQSISVNAPIEVKVPEGLPPEKAAEATRQGVADSLGAMLRDTQRQVSTPVVE